MIEEVDWVDPILYLLDTSLTQCFAFEGFSDDQMAAFALDWPQSQGLIPRLMEVLSKTNRGLRDSRVTGYFLSFFFKNLLLKSAFSNVHDEPVVASPRIHKKLKRLDRFTRSVEHLHAHHLAFAGTKSLYISF